MTYKEYKRYKRRKNRAKKRGIAKKVVETIKDTAILFVMVVLPVFGMIASWAVFGY